MRLIYSGDELAVTVTLDEPRLLASAIGEALEAVDEWEFSTRLGFDPRTRGHCALRSTNSWHERRARSEPLATAPMTNHAGRPHRPAWLLAFLAAALAVAVGMLGAAPTLAASATYTYDTYDAPARLLTVHAPVAAVRGSPAEPGVVFVSADVLRSIRFGPSEMGSVPTKFHFHDETPNFDSGSNTWFVENVLVRVPSRRGHGDAARPCLVREERSPCGRRG